MVVVAVVVASVVAVVDVVVAVVVVVIVVIVVAVGVSRVVVVVVVVVVVLPGSADSSAVPLLPLRAPPCVGRGRRIINEHLLTCYICPSPKNATASLVCLKIGCPISAID